MPGRRPLLNTDADQRLFILDDSRARAAAAALQPQRNVLISGEPGSGKSSLLYHVLGRARSQQRPALMLAGRLVEDSRGLVNALLELAGEEEWVLDAPAPNPDDPLGPARQIRRLREAPENALVLADDLTVEQAQTLFGQLRDELWQTPVNFAAAVRPDVAQALSAPPADVFFDRRFTLEPLQGGDANMLLLRRHEADESTLLAVFDDQPMQPRALVALAAQESPGGRYDPVRQSELLQIAENAAGRAGAMLLAEIWGREGVSASDPELQRSLGVTRNRLTELLRTLAAAGVLTTFPEPREGKTGRPRMIYTVADR